MTKAFRCCPSTPRYVFRGAVSSFTPRNTRGTHPMSPRKSKHVTATRVSFGAVLFCPAFFGRDREGTVNPSDISRARGDESMRFASRHAYSNDPARERAPQASRSIPRGTVLPTPLGGPKKKRKKRSSARIARNFGAASRKWPFRSPVFLFTFPSIHPPIHPSTPIARCA